MSKYDNLKYWAKTKARIPHHCQKCGAVVPKGEFYYKEKVDFLHPPGLAFGELCLKCGEEEKSSAMTQPTVCDIASTGIKVIFGDAQNMKELPDKSVQLVVTSPPYFNAPFDYPGLFEGYAQFLQVMRNIAKELKRVLDEGRIAALVTDDTLINGRKYPVVADVIKLFVDEGFRYRDRITWVKPEGYIRISRRSGVMLQHPYPMYYYPDNIQESILIFQNGDFDYKRIPKEVKEKSRVDLRQYQDGKWYLSVWYITNVLPVNNRLEKGVAAFPAEIPYRLINLFSYQGETVLDPFMGSGTTLKVAVELDRNAVGYEIDAELLETVKKKLNIDQLSLFKVDKNCSIIVREDVKHLRTMLQNRVEQHQGRKISENNR
jgi:DNA modification methylase